MALKIYFTKIERKPDNLLHLPLYCYLIKGV